MDSGKIQAICTVESAYSIQKGHELAHNPSRELTGPQRSHSTAQAASEAPILHNQSIVLGLSIEIEIDYKCYSHLNCFKSTLCTSLESQRNMEFYWVPPVHHGKTARHIQQRRRDISDSLIFPWRRQNQLNNRTTLQF